MPPGPGLDRAAAVPDIRRGRVVRWPACSRDRRAGCRRRHPGASSRRSGGRVPAGCRNYPPRRFASYRGPGCGVCGHHPCRGAGRQGSGRQARPASAHPGAGAVRSRGGRAVVRPSRCGRLYPQVGRGRRGRFGRPRRTSRLPGASGAGGGLARPAAPRSTAGRRRDRGPHRYRPAAARPAPRGPRRLSPSPGCTWNTMSCARRAIASARRTPPLA